MQLTSPILTFFCFLALICVSQGKEYFWTVKVQPGIRECFYESVKSGVEVEAEFQILSGGSRDVDFEVNLPSGQNVYNEKLRDNGHHEFKAEMDGDYEFCIDNQYGSWAEKLVFLDLGFNRDEYDDLPELPSPAPGGDGGDAVSEQTQTMGSSLQKVGQQLDQVRSIQEYLRVREARHRHTADDNLNRVFMWSFCECAALIVIGSIQVIVLRKMFADTGKTTA